MADPVASAPALDVHIVTPEREVWAGPATFVLARSAAGDLGVLAGHIPTLALLGAGPLEIHTVNEGKQEWGVDGGFLSVGKHGDHTRVDVLAERVTESADAVDPHSVVAPPAAGP